MITAARSLPATRAVLGTALLMLLAIAGLAPPALGHDVLVEAEPADGAVLESPPQEVVLRYSNEVLEMGPAVIVRAADGTVVAEGTPSVDGRTVTLALPQALGAGAYDVEWSVVSADGHRIQGDHGFEVAAAAEEPAGGSDPDDAAGEPAGGSEATDAAEEPAGSEPDQAADATTIEQGSADQSDGSGAVSDLPGWIRVLIGVVAVGAVAALVVLVVRRTRTGR